MSSQSKVDVRRHGVVLSDQEIRVLDHAVRAYAAIMRIRGATDSPREEADDNARVGSIIQEHKHCECPKSLEGG